MLVLTRKVDEKIAIGADIIIVVQRISPSQVSIGVQAPRDVPIMRMEVLERIRKANIEARSKGGQRHGRGS